MAEEPRYGSYDGAGSRFAPNEAWVLSEDQTKWTEINSIAHAHEVREISKSAFELRFPNAPPLPPEAFKEPRG